MKFRNSLLLLLVAILLMISSTGCNQSPQVNVTETLSSARDKMEAGDLDGALDEYEAVLAADSTNSEANFGAALLGVFSVAVDDNTRALAAKLGANVPSTLNGLITTTPTVSASSRIVNYSSFVQAAATPTITPGEVQTYIKNTLIPALDTALGRLAAIEADPDFKYVITSRMTRGGRDVEVDLGEIYALDLMGSMLKAMLHEAIAYNWDYSTSQPLNEPAFGTLKSDGPANMASARTAYIRMMGKWTAGINYIAAETDDQSDDAIPKFPSSSAREDFLKYIGLVKNSLENGDTTIDLNSHASIVVDLKQYYTSPIADWKTYANAVANSYVGFDYTINGAFPEMTTRADWDNLVNSLR
jgi:hypothetical protein